MASVNESRRMIVSVSEQLLVTLDELDADKLKRFKWFLKNHHGIPAADLEKSDAPDTVDLMMKRFGPEEAVKITVDILRKMNQNYLAEELDKKHKRAPAENSIEVPVPVGAQSEPINDSRQLTLDLNTAHKCLRLSENNRVITNTYTDEQYPDHPDRFDYFEQVLCRESVCGRCYWEIEWSGSVRISVSYKSISRKGRGVECGFGRNDRSWSLICYFSSYSFKHNNIETHLPIESTSRRIGVFVDHSAGTLSFYSVSHTMSLIHTVQTTFTQPLYPGIYVGYQSSLKLC